MALYTAEQDVREFAAAFPTAGRPPGARALRGRDALLGGRRGPRPGGARQGPRGGGVVTARAAAPGRSPGRPSRRARRDRVRELHDPPPPMGRATAERLLGEIAALGR